MLEFTSDQIVFISDTHFGHSNIINYCQRPFQFPDTSEMDRLMLQAMKDADDAGKTIIHLGDFLFKPNHEILDEWRPKGNHILVRGNHDKHANEKGRYETLYKEYFNHIIGESSYTWRTHGETIKIDGVMVFLSHEPQKDLNWVKYNVHGHHHNNMYRNPDYFKPEYDWLFGSHRHFNASVELTNYKTVTWEEVQRLIPPAR